MSKNCNNSTCEYRRKFAWRSYYQVLEQNYELARKLKEMSKNMVQSYEDSKVEIPEHFKNEFMENVY